MIIENRSRIIFPFVYDGYKGIKEYKRINSKGEEILCFEPFSVDAQELRQGVQGLLKENHSAKIASSFKLKIDARGEFMLPKKQDYILTLSNQKESFNFSIKDLYLHFFDTKVGFLVFDIEIKEEDVNKANDFRYYFCEVKSEKNILSFDEKISKDESKTTSTTLLSLIKKIMSYIDGATDFDQNPSFHYSENRPLCFSYFFLEEKDNREDVICNLGANYKKSYKVNDELITRFKPFINSTWLYSDNCVTNVSFKVDDDTTNNFFKNTFSIKFSTVYYLLYIAVLNQKFSMIHYMNRLVFNDNLSLPYDELKGEIELLRNKKEEFIVFKYRNLFEVPSSIAQINIYYQKLQECLQIKIIEKNLDGDMKLIIDSLNSLITKEDEYKKLIESKKSSVRDLILVFVSSILAFVSLFETITKLINIFGGSDSKVGNIVTFIVMFIICLVVPTIFNVQKNLKEIKNKNKQIEKMKKTSTK